MTTESADVLIIGGGIAGASLAYELATTRHVIVLEGERQAGYHTTGRSAALYSEIYGNAVIRKLSSGGRAFFESPPKGFADHPLLQPRGTLFFAREDQLALLDAEMAELEAEGLLAERVSAEEAVRLVPVLRPDQVAGALFESASQDVDVDALHRGFLRGLAARGGSLRTDASVRALSRKDGVWIAETDAGTYSAPVLVNAAGAWADEIAELAGAKPCGLVPKRRTAFTFDGPEGKEFRGWPAAGDIGESFYFKPDAGRLLGSPADETPSPPCDAQPEELDVAMGVDRIERATTLKIPKLASKWAGLRSFVADKSPVAGFDPDVDGFFWLAGQGGYGIQTSPAMARLAAGLIAEDDIPADLRARGLTRSMLAPERLR